MCSTCDRRWLPPIAKGHDGPVCRHQLEQLRFNTGVAAHHGVRGDAGRCSSNDFANRS